MGNTTAKTARATKTKIAGTRVVINSPELRSLPCPIYSKTLCYWRVPGYAGVRIRDFKSRNTAKHRTGYTVLGNALVFDPRLSHAPSLGRSNRSTPPDSPEKLALNAIKEALSKNASINDIHVIFEAQVGRRWATEEETAAWVKAEIALRKRLIAQARNRLVDRVKHALVSSRNHKLWSARYLQRAKADFSVLESSKRGVDVKVVARLKARLAHLEG